MRNKKGFTLIEVILVTLLLAMLGVAAITSYTNTSSTYIFLGNFKSIMSSVRFARASAVTNVQANVIPRYGVEISDDGIVVFADDGTVPFEKDEEDRVLKNVAEDFGERYEISTTEATPLPHYIYYDSGTGELTAFGTGSAEELVLLPKTDSSYKYLNYEFSDTVGDLHRYFVIFQVSGLAEEFITEPI